MGADTKETLLFMEKNLNFYTNLSTTMVLNNKNDLANENKI